MRFFITDIEFDFTDSQGELDEWDQSELNYRLCGTTWDASDEDELMDDITDTYGWCIKYIKCEEVLTP